VAKYVGLSVKVPVRTLSFWLSRDLNGSLASKFRPVRAAHFDMSRALATSGSSWLLSRTIIFIIVVQHPMRRCVKVIELPGFHRADECE
jgi:hypothetical protein